MQTFIALYVINLIGSNLLSTGAFEVYVGDELVWSKLETGTLPDYQYLLQEITKEKDFKHNFTQLLQSILYCNRAAC